MLRSGPLSDGPLDGIGDGIEGEGIGDGVVIEAIEGVDGQTNAIRTDVIEFRHIVPQLSEGDPPPPTRASPHSDSERLPSARCCAVSPVDMSSSTSTLSAFSLDSSI